MLQRQNKHDRVSIYKRVPNLRTRHHQVHVYYSFFAIGDFTHMGSTPKRMHLSENWTRALQRGMNHPRFAQFSGWEGIVLFVRVCVCTLLHCLPGCVRLETRADLVGISAGRVKSSDECLELHRDASLSSLQPTLHHESITTTIIRRNGYPKCPPTHHLSIRRSIHTCSG